ncbi:hypothetical protein AA12717_1382 [Gluconacetobacter sacchari DSM 12717]|uniref:Cytochrome c domain-containing protein n=1 Tax=Gluconacetobacter sacchari DSM 12717 TaxID=1307940 RepID=A0ABQ0P5L5_9PROT|nr:hypothetical protein AA12717_1382 [Gluconacetobacter sacchari DSM 12717]
MLQAKNWGDDHALLTFRVLTDPACLERLDLYAPLIDDFVPVRRIAGRHAATPSRGAQSAGNSMLKRVAVECISCHRHGGILPDLHHP